MAPLQFVRPEDRRFVPVSECVTERDVAQAHPDELKGMVFVRYAGGPDELELLEIRYPAHTRVSPHAHAVDEILVVIDGEVQFGGHSFRAGSSVLIPKLTLYSFRVGSEGVTLLNFRPRHDPTVMRKEEVAVLLQQRLGRS